jgi:hypothetical protein
VVRPGRHTLRSIEVVDGGGVQRVRSVEKQAMERAKARPVVTLADEENVAARFRRRHAERLLH